MALGFTDPGGSRPTPNRPTREYRSVRRSVPSFQDPGISAGQFGFGSRDRDRDRNDGPNIVLKSKPNVPTSRQQSVFAPTTSSRSRMQYYDRLGGGVAPLADIRNITNRFQRAADIPGYLAKQKDYRAFTQYAGEGPAPRFTQGPLAGQQILSMNEPQLTAMAPTFGQFMGDIRRGAGAFVSDLAEKGSPMMNLAKDLIGGVQNFFTGSQGPGTTAQGPQNLGLTPGQLNLYNNLVGNGMNPAMAFEQAKRYNPEVFPKSFAMGGIATLN